jgi:hypothetical protein
VNCSNYHTTPEPNFWQQFLVNLAQKNSKNSNFGQKKLTTQKKSEKIIKKSKTPM